MFTIRLHAMRDNQAPTYKVKDTIASQKFTRNSKYKPLALNESPSNYSLKTTCMHLDVLYLPDPLAGHG